MRHPKLNVKEALQEVEEVKNIVCETCTNVTVEGDIYCLSCRSYWDDVENGLFDRIGGYD